MQHLWGKNIEICFFSSMCELFPVCVFKTMVTVIRYLKFKHSYYNFSYAVKDAKEEEGNIFSLLYYPYFSY